MFAKYSVGAQRAAPALARHLLCPKTTLYSAGINRRELGQELCLKSYDQSAMDKRQGACYDSISSRVFQGGSVDQSSFRFWNENSDSA